MISMKQKAESLLSGISKILFLINFQYLRVKDLPEIVEYLIIRRNRNERVLSFNVFTVTFVNEPSKATEKVVSEPNSSAISKVKHYPFPNTLQSDMTRIDETISRTGNGCKFRKIYFELGLIHYLASLMNKSQHHFHKVLLHPIQ